MGEIGRGVLWVATGGALGSAARYLSLIALQQFGYTNYWSVMMINLVGSLLLGMLVGYGVQTSTTTWAFLSLGVLGGYTTFSTFSLQLLELLQKEQISIACAYIFCSVSGGLLCALAGMLFSKYLLAQTGVG